MRSLRRPFLKSSSSTETRRRRGSCPTASFNDSENINKTSTTKKQYDRSRTPTSVLSLISSTKSAFIVECHFFYSLRDISIANMNRLLIKELFPLKFYTQLYSTDGTTMTRDTDHNYHDNFIKIATQDTTCTSQTLINLQRTYFFKISFIFIYFEKILLFIFE